MVNRGKKNILEKILFSQKFLTLIGLVVLILIAYPFAKNAIKQYRINKEIAGLKKEIADLQSKGQDLKSFVSYLESDQFAEEQARLSLGLKKPGEELTVIKTDNATNTAPTGQIFDIPGYDKAAPAGEPSNAKKWLDYFLK